MKRRYITVMLLFLLAATFSYAQDKIEKNVEVTNVYEASLVEETKSPLNTKFADSLLNLNVYFDYSIFDKPYRDLYEFSPIESYQVGVGRGKPLYPVMYSKIRLGTSAFGNIEPLGSLYIRPRFGEKFSMLFYYTHDSKWGKLPKAENNFSNVQKRSGQMVLADDMFNKFGFATNYSWKKGNAYAALDYVNSFNTFFGSDYIQKNSHMYMRDSLSHAVNKLDVRLGAKSMNPDRTDFYYDVSFRYRYADEYRVGLPELVYNPYLNEKEHVMDIKADFGALFKSKHLVYLGMNSYNHFLSSDRRKPSGVFELKPSYLFENSKVHLRLGLTGAFAYGGFKAKDIAFLYPEIDFKFNVIRNYLWLNVLVSGSNTINSYYTLTDMNKWLSGPVEIENTSMPLAAELNINGKAGGVFSYSLGCSYSYRNNMPLLSYNPENHNMADIIYADKVNTFKTNIEAYVNLDYLDVAAKFRYYNYFGKVLSMMPDMEAEASIRYNYMHRIFAGIKCYYRNSVTAMANNGDEFRVGGFFDLGLEFSYAINQELSVFLEARNILNQTIIYVPNYIDNVPNFSVGIYFRL